MFDTTHLHPMIVHFPIALLIVGFLFDLISLFSRKELFSTVGLYLLILGTLGVIAAFFSGNFAGDGISEAGSLKQALETHEGAAEIALWLMIAAAVLRIAFVWMKRYSGVYKYVAIGIFLLGVLAIARTGYYGGELVFKHAAGVQFNVGLDSNSGTSSDEKE
ncbi:MAG: DUF2231 domain-containing protein [Ignavibacteriales bacterium]